MSLSAGYCQYLSQELMVLDPSRLRVPSWIVIDLCRMYIYFTSTFMGIQARGSELAIKLVGLPWFVAWF